MSKIAPSFNSGNKIELYKKVAITGISITVLGCALKVIATCSKFVVFSALQTGFMYMGGYGFACLADRCLSEKIDIPSKSVIVTIAMALLGNYCKISRSYTTAATIVLLVPHLLESTWLKEQQNKLSESLTEGFKGILTYTRTIFFPKR